MTLMLPARLFMNAPGFLPSQFDTAGAEKEPGWLNITSSRLGEHGLRHEQVEPLAAVPPFSRHLLRTIWKRQQNRGHQKQVTAWE